jgi:hypothetical protein
VVSSPHRELLIRGREIVSFWLIIARSKSASKIVGPQTRKAKYPPARGPEVCLMATGMSPRKSCSMSIGESHPEKSKSSDTVEFNDPYKSLELTEPLEDTLRND